MEIEEIEDKAIWEDFLEGVEEKTFLQSWNWGEFNKMMGEKVWRIGIYQQAIGDRRQATEKKSPVASRQLPVASRQLIGVALVVKVSAKRGNFLLAPHGPIIKLKVKSVPTSSRILDEIGKKLKVLKMLLEKLKKIAKTEKVSFIRINPIWGRTEENIKIFKDLGFKNAPIHIHPEATWQIDVVPSEDDLLRNMRKTTRYLIRKAQKDKNIEVIQSQELKYIKIFSELHKRISERQHFFPFSFDYLKNEFSAFKDDNQISLFLGKYKGKIIALAFVIFYSGKGFYHHAVLDSEYSRIPIAYLILWEAIKEAKKRGCLFFDFWGYVSPKESPNHPWAGPTLFKMGFGGEKKEYVKTQDYPLSLSYFKTWAVEKLRRIRRRL